MTHVGLETSGEPLPPSVMLWGLHWTDCCGGCVTLSGLCPHRQAERLDTVVLALGGLDLPGPLDDSHTHQDLSHSRISGLWGCLTSTSTKETDLITTICL